MGWPNLCSEGQCKMTLKIQKKDKCKFWDGHQQKCINRNVMQKRCNLDNVKECKFYKEWENEAEIEFDEYGL